MGKYACYGVRNVPRAGVYKRWDEAEAAFRRISGEEHKGFHSQEEALAWVNAGTPRASNDVPQATRLPSGAVAIDCPYKDKEAAKSLGARWDGNTWYVPPGLSLEPFARWTKSTPSPTVATHSYEPSSSFSSHAAGVKHNCPLPLAHDGIVEGELALYTDGACKGNNHVHARHCPAGWGVAVVADRALPHGGHCIEELFAPVELDPASPHFLGAEVASNNTAELSAVCEALLWLLRQPPSAQPPPAAICYDSEYAAKQVQGEWKTNKNLALVNKGKILLSQVVSERKIRFIHVKGHSNHQWNELADKLANRGANGLTKRESNPHDKAWVECNKRKREAHDAVVVD